MIRSGRKCVQTTVVGRNSLITRTVSRLLIRSHAFSARAMLKGWSLLS